MENTPAVSVIIPMYNAEKYLGECLESVLEQTFQDFEVILVNDCSTDSSRQVAESYLKKFGGRLKIYDNEKNSGVAITRNNGLRLAHGEYIFFMDSDDLILANSFEELYRIANNFGVDFVNITRSYKLSNDGSVRTPVILKPVNPGNTPILESNLEWRVKNLFNNVFAWAPWRKFLRREFLIQNEIFFPDNVKTCEDEIWTMGLLFCAKKIVHVPLAIYLYRLSDNSLTRAKRTPLQNISYRINTIIQGQKWINNIMNKIPFFEKNPQYHYGVLSYVTQRYFTKLYNSSLKISPTEMYRSIWQEFGKNFGEYEVAIPVLCTMLNQYQKLVEKNKLRIAELEEQLKAKQK